MDGLKSKLLHSSKKRNEKKERKKPKFSQQS